VRRFTCAVCRRSNALLHGVIETDGGGLHWLLFKSGHQCSIIVLLA
jgi:hypothetical protein